MVSDEGDVVKVRESVVLFLEMGMGGGYRDSFKRIKIFFQAHL